MTWAVLAQVLASGSLAAMGWVAHRALARLAPRATTLRGLVLAWLGICAVAVSTEAAIGALGPHPVLDGILVLAAILLALVAAGAAAATLDLEAPEAPPLPDTSARREELLRETADAIEHLADRLDGVCDACDLQPDGVRRGQ